MSKDVIRVTMSSMPPFGEYCKEIRSIWDSHWLTNFGEKHQELERQLVKYLDIPNIHLFSNGHQALEIAIDALELTGEVITTPFTFASTTLAIMRKGLTPVFCDIDENDYTIDADKIESLITEKTSAIMPVHVYGNICNYKKIEQLASKYNLKVIYDGAHAFGEKVDGRSVASLGDITMFSFHATKVFNSIEGGCLAFKDSNLKDRIHALCQFGFSGEDDVSVLGTNSKMNEFQAAMGICNMRHINEYIDKRKACVGRYRERLDGIDGITLCKEKENTVYNYSYFPVVFDEKILGKNRDDIAKALESENIFARKYFYPITSDFTAIREKCSPAYTPVAKRISENVLTLPLYAELSFEDIDRICDTILRCCKA